MREAGSPESEIQRGALVYRRKGPVMHVGISLGDGRVLHNTPRRGEHISTLEEFACGKPIRISPVSTEAEARLEHLDMEAFERSYNLITNNCEHTASRAARGQASSPQLEKVAVGASLAVAAMSLLIFRKSLPGLGAFVISRIARHIRIREQRNRQQKT